MRAVPTTLQSAAGGSKIRKCLSCRASTGTRAQEPALAKRHLLVSGLAYCLLQTAPAQAKLCVEAATAEEADECFRGLIKKDEGKQESYGSVSSRKFELVGGDRIPIAVLDNEYAKATVALGEQIQRYADMDVYDKARVPLIKAIKTDSASWVSKYARGGSVRAQSARKMYIAIDALSGHFAANGLAPCPATKLKVVLGNIDEALVLLSEAK